MRQPRKRYVVLILATVITVATLFALLRYTSIVAKQVAIAFTENLLSDRGYRLEVGAVRGNPLSHLDFLDVQLVTARQPRELAAEAAVLKVRFDGWKLFKGQIQVASVILESPVVHWGPTGIRPELWKSNKKSASQALMPPIEIDHFGVRNGVFILQKEAQSHTIERISWDMSIRAQGRDVQIVLAGFEANLRGDSLELLQLQGKLNWEQDSLKVVDLRFKTHRSEGSVTGWFHPESQNLKCAGEAEPFNFDDVSSVVSLPFQGRLQGPFEVSRIDSTVCLKTNFSGSYDHHELQGLQIGLLAGKDQVDLECAGGTIDGAAFSLALHGEQGVLSGEADFEGVDLQRIAFNDSLPKTAWTGSAVFHKEADDKPLLLNVRLKESRIEDWVLQNLEARIEYSKDAIHVDSLMVQSDGSRLIVDGDIRDDVLALNWHLDSYDLAKALAPLGVNELSLSGKVNGTLQGPLTQWSLDGEGQFNTIRYLEFSLPYAEVGFVVQGGENGVKSRLDVRAEALSWKGRHFESVTSSLEIRDGAVDVNRVKAVSGDTLFEAIGAYATLQNDWLGNQKSTHQLKIETVLLQVGLQEIRIEDPALIRWTQNAVRVDSLRMATRGGAMRLDGNIDFGDSRVDMRAEIQHFDLDFLQSLNAFDQRVSGAGTGWLELHGDLERTQIDARLRLQDGAWNTLPFDSIRVDLQSDAFSVELRSLLLATPQGSLEAQGRLAYLPSVRRWLEGKSGSRSPEDLARATVEARVTMTQLQMDQIWMARDVEAEDPDWNIRISTTLDVQGSVGSPKVKLSGFAQDAAYQQVQADSLRFSVTYAQGEVDLQELVLTGRGAQLQAKGRLPADLHLAQGLRLRRQDPLDFTVTVPRSSFSLATQLIPIFEVPPPHVSAGEVVGELRVTGTMDDPRARGTMALTNAGFTLTGMDEVYQGTRATAVFDGKRLELSAIEAHTGEKGVVRGAGYLLFDGFKIVDYEVGLDGDQVSIFSVPGIAVNVTGHVDVRARDLGYENPVPEFSGDLRVLDALVTTEFGNTTDSGGSNVFESTDRPDWLADVTLTAPGNVWIRNTQADFEIEGDVRVTRNQSGVDINGNASVKRGTYTLFVREFSITKGELDFSQNAGFEPELNVEARSGRAGNRYYVTITGRPPDDLKYQLSSDEGQSHAAIERELFRLDNRERDNLLGDVLEQIVEDLDFIDAYTESINIEPGRAQKNSLSSNDTLFPFLPSSMNVSAGKALSDRVFLVYTRGFRSDIRQRVALEVEIGRGLLLESSYERRNITDKASDRAQNAVDINLKFRYEY